MLDADRQCHLLVVEALVHPVGYGPVVEQRRVHLVHRGEQCWAAAHVQESLLLAGERGLGQILGGGRGAHRDRDRVTAHAGPALEHGLLERRRQRRREDPLPDLGAAGGELADVVDVETLKLGRDAFGEAGLGEELAKALGRGREPAGHLDPGARELADHLADRRILAADPLDVVHPELFERDDVPSHAQVLGRQR